MEESIKNELIKKANKAFKEEEISENILNELKKVIEMLLTKSSDDTPDINIQYAFDLFLLAMKFQNFIDKHYDQESSAKIAELGFNYYIEAREKYKKIKDFENRYCDYLILTSFLTLLNNALVVDFYNNIKIETLTEMRIEAKEAYEKLIVFKYPKRTDIYRRITDIYLGTLLHISKREQNDDSKLKATLNEGERAINKLKEISPDELEELRSTFVPKLTKEKKGIGEEDGDKSKLLSHWLQIVINSTEDNTEDKTKSEVLRDIFKKYRGKVEVIEKISTIYINIQKIKQLLVVEDFKDLKFGHYTNGEVLQTLLNSKEEISNIEKYEITGKTRLYNVAYMNDPEEGKLLDSILGFHKSISLDDKVATSPWFLMSLTNAIDDLTMWSQYGNNAEGVCLEFKPDSFLEVKSQKDLEWLTIEAFKKDSVQKGYESGQEDTSKPKDCLYRICYLDEDSLKKCEIKIEEKDNELLKDKKVATVKVIRHSQNGKKKTINYSTVERPRHSQIEGSLKEIKGAINDVLKVAPEEIREELDKLLEEIRYLFKSSAYSYEKELRLLKYSELSSKNHLIKVHKVKPAAKLYIERETEIELNRIIFGPKFNKPEEVVPLVNLLDKQIKCERSSKKFR